MSGKSKSMTRQTDKDLKEQGNKYFNACKYDNAIDCYSKVGLSFIYYNLNNVPIRFSTIHVENFFTTGRLLFLGASFSVKIGIFSVKMAKFSVKMAKFSVKMDKFSVKLQLFSVNL